ncbi:MAG TPA: DUF6230 family protein [Streptosporangiaceae bacterium]|nr:DUF6230 family protein [Streptosporangiaceae bacterium]
MAAHNKPAPASGGRGRVSWRRFAAIMVPAAVLAAVLVLLTAQSVLAVSFSISGTPFTVTAKVLRGRGFEQFGVLDTSVLKVLPGHSNQIVLTANAIRYATLSHLCQAVTLGGLTLRITAGNGRVPVSATDLVVDADKLSGNVTFTNVHIGQDASTLNQVPGVRGPAGDFGQQATSVVITNLYQHAYATTAGTFKLPGFSLKFGGSC